MVGFVDTHCHLDMIMPRLARERQREAEKAGESPQGDFGFEQWRDSLQGKERRLEGCITIGCSEGSLDATEAFLAYDGVHAAFGIHPLSAAEWSGEVETKLERLMGLPKAVALGECGLDYYDKNFAAGQVDSETQSLQRGVFVRQMELAVSLGKPLIVHTRCAEEDTLRLMSAHLPPEHPVHVHCFTSSKELAQELLARFPRLCLGFTGVVNFKNGQNVRDVMEETPLDRILLETDGPYMAPVPHRGRVAHPGHVANIAEKVAEVKGVPLEEVLRTCRENTQRVYGF